ncbi:MAG: Do family serine endopeptidase [Pseudomonadota bacterium]
MIARFFGHFFATMTLLATVACAQAQDQESITEEAPIGAARFNDAMGESVPQSMTDVKMSFAPVVDKAAPAVVNIYTSRTVNLPARSSFFDQFFGNAGPRQQTSLGSGVIVSPDGVIVTNNHVIEGMSEIKVVFADRREFSAEKLLTDPKTDLAVLKIEIDEPLPFLEFANSETAEVGDIVLAIGNPFGVGQTVTTGIVSALARTAVSISDYQFFIQTDAAINPGNSGGALVDVDGKLLGVNTAIYSRSGGSNGIGFAIPARLVQQVITTAMRGGDVQRPWVGAATETVTSALAEALDLDRPAGAIINDIYKGAPLAKAGLKSGDVITAIEGKPVFDAATLRYRVGISEQNEPQSVEFVRNGKVQTADVSFNLPPEKPAPDERTLSGRHPLTNVTIANLSPKFNEELNINPLLEGVVVVDVPRRSYARSSNLRRGYRLLTLNDREIKSTVDLEKALARPVSEWRFTVDTGKRVATWCTTSRGRRCR